MNKIYNTYKASEEGFDKLPIFSAPINNDVDGVYTFVAEISIVKSFNRASALALLESVREMMKEKAEFWKKQRAIRYPEYVRGINNCGEELYDLIKSIDQAEQLIKQ